MSISIMPDVCQTPTCPMSLREKNVVKETVLTRRNQILLTDI